MNWLVTLGLGIWIGVHFNSYLDSQVELAKAQRIVMNQYVQEPFKGTIGR